MAAHYLEPRTMCITRPGERPIYFPLYPDRSYTFGRADAEILFDDDTVSRLHGRLSYRGDGRWVYRDLGSTNGSYLSEYPFENDAEHLLRLQPSLDHELSVGQSVLLAKGGRVTMLLELPRGALEPKHAAQSKATERLEELVLESSMHRMPVFLLGPTGSGKSYLARRIHELSGVTAPFEAVNCAALPADANALRSELLGHVPGAYTGAAKSRIGKLRHADGGTVFLDEVESMPAEAQRFLLDLLDGTGTFSPLGAPADHHEPPPRFRLISASKRPLKHSALREDLVHRLARGVTIRVPTLEERTDDIPALVDAFLQRMSDEQRVSVRMTREALRLLQARRWPGHVRELQGIVQSVAERAVAKARARLRRSALEQRKTQLIRLEDLARALQGDADDVSEQTGPVEISAALLKEHLDEHDYGLEGEGTLPPSSVVVELPPVTASKRPRDYTREDLQAALGRNGTLAATARALGMTVNTLKAHLRRHGLRDGGNA